MEADMDARSGSSYTVPVASPLVQSESARDTGLLLMAQPAWQLQGPLLVSAMQPPDAQLSSPKHPWDLLQYEPQTLACAHSRQLSNFCTVVRVSREPMRTPSREKQATTATLPLADYILLVSTAGTDVSTFGANTCVASYCSPEQQ
jgi:hypothetical protein